MLYRCCCTQRCSFPRQHRCFILEKTLDCQPSLHGFRRSPQLQTHITEEKAACWIFLQKHLNINARDIDCGVAGKHFFMNEFTQPGAGCMHPHWHIPLTVGIYPHILHTHAKHLLPLISPLLRKHAQRFLKHSPPSEVLVAEELPQPILHRCSHCPSRVETLSERRDEGERGETHDTLGKEGEKWGREERGTEQKKKREGHTNCWDWMGSPFWSCVTLPCDESYVRSAMQSAAETEVKALRGAFIHKHTRTHTSTHTETEREWQR